MKENVIIDRKSILVVGDIMLDTYYSGDVKRISPEAPVPVFKKEKEYSIPGGAANVAVNLVAAGQNVSLMSIVGNDAAGNTLMTKLSNRGINTELVLSVNRRTTEKTRFLATNNQQVMRLDIEDTNPLEIEESMDLLKRFKIKERSFSLIILSDYLKGLLSNSFTQEIIHLANNHGIPVIVDVKDRNTDKYSHATLLKPNLKELCDLTGLKVDSDKEIIEASEHLRKQCNCKYVLTTCGGRGMVLVGDDEPYFIDAYGQEVFDVTGAGDTTIAYLGACMASSINIRDAVDIANLSAGIQVSKVGTSAVYWAEIRERLDNGAGESVHKVISGKALDSFRKDNEDKKIVFTNGCFDLLHIGHIRYLQEAAKLGDILIVGVNSDDSVKRIKGPERPINCENDRAEMLGALGFVDYVVVFSEDTPLELIKKIQPDVLVKGGDYLPKDVIGAEEVEQRGGSLVILPFVDGKSTSGIIKKIKKD